MRPNPVDFSLRVLMWVAGVLLAPAGSLSPRKVETERMVFPTSSDTGKRSLIMATLRHLQGANARNRALERQSTA